MRHPADSSDAAPASEPKAGTALPSIHVANVASASSSTLEWRSAVAVFLTFAFAYFLSALVRAVTATLAPTLAQEFALQARDLGLLAGGYFLGFAAMQLPLGRWLDRHGPRKVSLGFLGVAVLGCLVFSQAMGFAGLLAGRVLCGAGVSACLMAPLTGYRRWLEPTAQMRANSWMLMTGSLGMVASTLPVQWALPLVGWRPLFWALAGLIALAMLLIALRVPAWRAALPEQGATGGDAVGDTLGDVAPPAGYRMVWRHPYFQRLAPLAFCVYGGMVAVQTLWAGPWMQQVAGYTPLQAATGLFWIKCLDALHLLDLGHGQPLAAAARGWDANRLMALGACRCAWWCCCASVLAGPARGRHSLGAVCACRAVLSRCRSLLVAMAFVQALAGRALSAYNLVIFAGRVCGAVGHWPGRGRVCRAGLGHVRHRFRRPWRCTWLATWWRYAWFVLQPRRHNAKQTAHP